MLGDFFSWWFAQLADLVPPRWRALASAREDAFVVAPIGRLAEGADMVNVTLRRRGSETPVGRFALTPSGLAELPRASGTPWVLRLAEADVLAKTVTLPLAAERHLRDALGFEMDQETPFTAEEIFWNHSIARRDRQSGRLSVRLLLVPRASLGGLLRALDNVGIAPKRAEIADGQDRDCYLPLDGNGGSLSGATHRAVRWTAALCCLLLGLGAVATPFIQQAMALSSIDRQIAAARATADEAEHLRRDITQLTGTIDLVQSERDKAGQPLAILATLTRILPDDTYLTEFTQQQRKITLSGRSAGAARLIGALSAGEALRNVAFAAPVTRLEAIKAEVFTITAEVVP